MTCRDVSQKSWEQARAALIFYFQKRVGFQKAEDLAQQTIERILTKEEFTFEQESDFLRVCLGFAAKIRFEEYRKETKRQERSLEDCPAATGLQTQTREKPEIRIYLEEVLRIAKKNLRNKDWSFLEEEMELFASHSTETLNAAEQNRLRVRRHRLREKLQKLLNWKPTVL